MFFRIALIIFLFILLCLLGAYAAWQGPAHELTSWEAVAQAEKYQGEEIAGSYNRVIGGLDDYLVIGPFGHQINLRVDPELEIRPHDFISFKGRVHRDGYIIVEEIHLHKTRSWKYLASLVPAVVILIWFLRRYKFNFKEFYFEKR